MRTDGSSGCTSRYLSLCFGSFIYLTMERTPYVGGGVGNTILQRNVRRRSSLLSRSATQEERGSGKRQNWRSVKGE